MNYKNKEFVKMIGMDFGSTTSSAMVARAAVGQSSVTGRMALGNPEIIYRSKVEFTPFNGDKIDTDQINSFLNQWLKNDEDLFSGGCIITGLAARQKNASSIAALVKDRIGQSVIATVDDPNLESWLAFMGCSATLSRLYKTKALINLDIGGGTTNPAAGINGQVSSTGCFYVGARHFRFEQGTYKLQHISDFGKEVCDHLGLGLTIGDVLKAEETDMLICFYLETLKSMVKRNNFFNEGIGKKLCQTPFDTSHFSEIIVTFSGGVGELIYRIASGEEASGTTFYGDLGIDLAQKIISDPFFSEHIKKYRPENMGRATVYGLTLHNTEISGATVFLPNPEILPLSDIPIVSKIEIESSVEEIRKALGLFRQNTKICIQMVNNESQSDFSYQKVKEAGLRIDQAITESDLTEETYIIILVPENFGKALGNYSTNWGNHPHNLIIIDEIPDRNAKFVNIGSPYRSLVPVSFYGIY